ncbi:MAG: hypothetical protein O3B84_05605 [Chloroflexi bacterium]|nr:hypothetical protein [Chloroflexota bacterium]
MRSSPLARGAGATRTAIMYGSNLSHDQLVRYLAYLTDQELLELQDDGMDSRKRGGQNWRLLRS